MKKTISIFFVLIAICFVIMALLFVINPSMGFGYLDRFNNWTGGDPAIPTKNEIVMPPLSTIEAETLNGKIIIKSGKGLKHYYSWGGETRYVIMQPREERWYGSLGLYYPGTGFHWGSTADGVKRGVLEEGHQYFKTKEKALKWIKKQVYWGAVYRDDGLLVQFNKTGAPVHTLSVGVWQIYIDGKKPKQLIGSKNNTINTSWGKN